MKKLILIVSLALVSFSVSAQTRSFRDFYKKYSGAEGYTAIEISGAMMNAMGNGVIVSGTTTDVGSIMDKIDNMIIVITEDPGVEFTRDVANMIKGGGYVSMTIIKDGGQTSEFYSVQKDGKPSEFLMTVLGRGDNVIMSIVGKDLDVSQITRLAGKSQKE